MTAEQAADGGRGTLALEGVDCYYGQVQVLRHVSLSVTQGEVVCLLGRNGAGKTTALRTLMGLLEPREGRIRLDGRDVTGIAPHQIPRLGLAYVPQGRRLFPFLTVEENLRMGLLLAGDDRQTLDSALDLFPVLRERLRQRAGTLSGGEQQMVATARALCTRPRFLLLDEPSEGLMPTLVERLLEIVGTLRARGVGVLLVEQKIDAALRVADAVALMENGTIPYRGAPDELAARPDVLLRHLGVRRSPGPGEGRFRGAGREPATEP